MDHTLAHQTNKSDQTMIDRYLINDLTQEERLAFENHMFDCPDCAAQVKQGFEMIDGLKDVMREDDARAREIGPVKSKFNWRDWFRPISLVPACAALALAFVVGYQNEISIPALLQPQVLDTTPIVSNTRGGESETVRVKAGAAFFGVSFAVFSPKANAEYVCEFIPSAKTGPVSMDCGKHAGSEFNLNLMLPAAKFPAGGYTMILRPADEKQTEISRYLFAVKNEGN